MSGRPGQRPGEIASQRHRAERIVKRHRRGGGLGRPASGHRSARRALRCGPLGRVHAPAWSSQPASAASSSAAISRAWAGFSRWHRNSQGPSPAAPGAQVFAVLAACAAQERIPAPRLERADQPFGLRLVGRGKALPQLGGPAADQTPSMGLPIGGARKRHAHAADTLALRALAGAAAPAAAGDGAGPRRRAAAASMGAR